MTRVEITGFTSLTFSRVNMTPSWKKSFLKFKKRSSV
jgi:hypothetical protein